MIALALLHPLILLLVAVLVGIIIVYAVAQFIDDARIMTIIKLIIGLVILLYALNLFGVIV